MLLLLLLLRMRLAMMVARWRSHLRIGALRFRSMRLLLGVAIRSGRRTSRIRIRVAVPRLTVGHGRRQRVAMHWWDGCRSLTHLLRRRLRVLLLRLGWWRTARGG